MEMNTRLQVEHPITEMITGTDLVEWQIRIASGEPLPLTQEQIVRKGHAFEARIYAEDPRGGFLPGAGPLHHLTTPAANENVRVETGVRQGDEVSIHYDPMIAKLVVWGENRTQALDSLIARLADYHITGLETNVNFLIDLASHPNFRAADVHTGFIPEHFDTLFPEIKISENVLSQAAVALILNETNAAQTNSARTGNSTNPFGIESNLRLNHVAIREFKLKFGEKVFNIGVKNVDGELQVKVDSGDWRKVSANQQEHSERFSLRCSIDGVFSNFSAVISPEEISIFADDGKTSFEIVPPKFLSDESSTGGSIGSTVISPMPGVLDKMLVKPGDSVKKGEALAVIIAMKMEHVLKASRDGVVKSVGGKAGDNVAKGKAIVVFEEVEE